MCRKVLLCAAAALILALSAGCTASASVTGATAPPEHSRPVDVDVAAPAQPKSTPEPTPAPTPEPTPTPTPEPTPPPWPPYEFGVPLEESDPVEDDSFFDNAVFLGDSRTEGLQLFGGQKHGTYYWARGMSVFRADSDQFELFEVDGEKLTLVGVLSKHQYDQVYLMIGINELGSGAEAYEKGLSELIDKVLAAQPEAVVYLQILPPVNDAMCSANAGLASYINNTNVQAFNEAIVRVAAEKKVVLLNTAEVYTGEDGQLPRELASDGCHFAYNAYTQWADYLRTHTIDPARYFDSREKS